MVGILMGEILLVDILVVGILNVGIFTDRNLSIPILVVSIMVIYHLVLRKCNSPNIVIKWSKVLLNWSSRIASIS